MKKFEILILSPFQEYTIIAEVYYNDLHLFTVSLKEEKLILQFYSCPNKDYWEFTYEEFVKVLEQAKNKLLAKVNKKNSFLPEVPVDPKQINDLAQEILDKILNHPEKKIIQGELKRFGKVIDIYAPGIGGARYNTEGEFIGFLEL